MNTITLKRTYYRTIAVLLLFSLLTHMFKSVLQPIPSLSLLNILAHENATQYLNLTVAKDLLLFCITLVAVLALWAYVISLSCQAFFKKCSDDNKRSQFWIILLLLHINLAIIANSYWYPTSLVSIYRHAPFTNFPIILITSSVCLGLYFYSLYILKKRKTIFASIGIVIFILYPNPYKIDQNKFTTTTQPNIFLIGLDALRPDHLHYDTPSQPNYLPYLNNYLTDALIYNKTYTPLPRTFVSWFSLLKGQYPNEHGGRFNLTPPELVDKNLPILEELKAQNYLTIYAIDERRFNQIDESYGFNKAVGPKLGFADQLTNRIADFPILNLLSQTRFGEYFLPFMHLNRANGKLYDPKQFNMAALSQLSGTRPNLFAIHLCMQHWPYTSKDFININSSYWQGNYNHFMYLSLMEQLDSQFKHLMETLKNKGYLENAQVFVFSDHGDGFMLNKDKLTAKHSTNLKLNLNAWGHGTSVTDQSQANVLLSKKTFVNGLPTNPPKLIDGNFSLIDIIPTIYADLGIKPNDELQGIKLPVENNQDLSNRFVFSNSSNPSKSLDTSFIKNDDVMYENMDIYKINEDGLMNMTLKAYNDIKQKQQRSVYYKNKQLAYFPDYGGFIGVYLSEKQWQPITQFNQDSDWYKMLNAFCNHYISADPDLIFKECESLNSTAFKQSLTKESLN